MTGIYKITNLVNGKMYIGQAVDIEERWIRHKRDWKIDKTKVLYKAIRKYGIENFSFEIIEECSEKELSNLEIYYIWYYHTYLYDEKCNGYNMTIGGETIKGYRHTEESKIKMSESHKGEKSYNFGKHLSEETRKKISEANKGKTHSEETRQKISDSIKGENNPFYGKTHSEETRQKMSENHADFTRGKNGKAKKVICEDMEFECLKDCAEFYGISYDTMKGWCNGRYKIPQDFVEKGLRYK